MGRRVLAFFLGMLFGIIFIVGGVAGAIYITLCVIKVEKLLPNAETYLGDLSHMSIYDIGQTIYNLYGEKKGLVDENGNYYTFGQFCANYNINPDEAFGIKLPQEVLDMPAFEVFNEGGVEHVMKQIKVSTIPAIVNMFKQDENGEGTFKENVMTELGRFSMYDLISNEEVGFKGVFANIRMAELAPSSFPPEDSDNKLMWAVGQTRIGGLLAGVAGNDSIMLQLKAGGALEDVGRLEITSVIGESQYVQALLGKDASFADLIADDGTMRFDEIIHGVSVGEILGCMRNEILDVSIYTEIPLPTTDSETVRVMTTGTGEEALYVKSPDGEIWYEAEFTCEETNEEHEHNVDCYGYVWYSATARADGENGSITDLVLDGQRHARTEGLYGVLANLSVQELTSGSDNALKAKIKKLKVRDIVGESTTSEVMKSLLDLTIEELMNGAIDNLFLGTFFKYHRVSITDLAEYGEETQEILKANDTEKVKFYLKSNDEGHIALSSDKKEWYVGRITCEEEDETHSHNGDCYGFDWYSDEECVTPATGIQGKFANKQIANLTNLNEEVKQLTLLDVMGESIPTMLKDIGDTKIGELESGINSLYLGAAMSYHRNQVEETEGYVALELNAVGNENVKVMSKVDGENTTFIKTDDGKIWYEAEFECENPKDDDHECDTGCYKYVWYKETSEGEKEPITGITKAFVNSKLNTVGNTMNHLTIRKLGIERGDNTILTALEDVEISKLGVAINDLKMGVVLGYRDGGVVEPENCSQDHQHFGDDCDRRWLTTTDVDGELIETEVEGLNAKIANKTIKQMTGSGLTDIAKNLTIDDLIKSEMMSVGGEENEYKLAIIYCGESDHNCNLFQFVAYKQLHSSTTAKDYWLQKHNTTEADLENNKELLEHRDAWRKMKLSEFISHLLNAI